MTCIGIGISYLVYVVVSICSPFLFWKLLLLSGSSACCVGISMTWESSMWNSVTVSRGILSILCCHVVSICSPFLFHIVPMPTSFPLLVFTSLDTWALSRVKGDAGTGTELRITYPLDTYFLIMYLPTTRLLGTYYDVVLTYLGNVKNRVNLQ